MLVPSSLYKLEVLNVSFVDLWSIYGEMFGVGFVK